VELVSSGSIDAEWNFLFYASDPWISATTELVAFDDVTEFHFVQLEGAVRDVLDVRGSFVVFGDVPLFTDRMSIAGFSSATG
jgi:hypothetical protein